MRPMHFVLPLASLGGCLLTLIVGATDHPSVRFTEPKNGATVEQTFKVKFEALGMKTEAAGPVVKNSGHHHILIDGKSLPKGRVIPKDEKNIHYGKGETEAELKLAPGQYTLTLQFADGAHRSYGPELSATITVNVK